MNLSSPSYQASFQSDLCGMSVKFSLMNPLNLAVSVSSNFGIVGNGKQLVLRMHPNGEMKVLNSFDLSDAVIDCTWTDYNQNLLITCLGNGIISLLDLQINNIVKEVKGHFKEVNCVECSYQSPNIFLSTGTDGRIKLWDLNGMKCLADLQASQGSCNHAVWHPVNDKLFSSVGADGILKIWDISSSKKCIASIKAHNSDVLCCDFNKYQDILATSSSDLSIRIWDIKNLSLPLSIFGGHRYPIKRVKYSPFSSNILASCSYDMNVCIWNTSDPIQPRKFIHNNHTECVMGLDFSLHNEKQISSTSWDGRVLVWDFDKPQPEKQ